MSDIPEISLEELQPISFLPVWIFYSIRLRGGLDQPAPLQLVRIIDEQLSPPADPSAWVTDFLKINLHKLFQQNLGDIKKPDFSNIDNELQKALDILLLHAVADHRIESLRLLLHRYCAAVAECPLPDNASPVARVLMQTQAKVIQKLLG